VIIAAKGGSLTDITVGDVLELMDVETEVLAGCLETARRLPDPARAGHSRQTGPGKAAGSCARGARKTPDELIDRYQLTCRPSATLLVDYLQERQPGLDYNSLRALAYYPGQPVWKDLELHHPDPSTACTCPSRLPPPGGSDC